MRFGQLLQLYPLSFVTLLSLLIMHFSFAIGLWWHCGKALELECTIQYLDLLKIHSVILRNITVGASFIRLSRFNALSLDHATIAHLAPTVRSLEIDESKPLQTIIIPSYFAITNLFVYKTQLKWIHFQRNLSLQVLAIKYSNLQQIPPSVVNLKHLQRISLQHSRIQHFNLDLLQWCPLLDTVDLIFNQIHTITSTLHGGQRRRLNALFLGKNHLNILNLELLAPLGWFTYVDLSNNRIELLVGRFSSEHIVTVSFSSNRLKTVDLCQWERMPSLTFISFISNELTRVPNCMNHLPNITTVSFIDNKLTSVSMDAFAGLDKLTALYLSNNMIRTITFHEDRYPTQLQELFLSGNRIECDGSDKPFCSLDINFQPSSPRSEWSRNKNALKRQLTIIA